MLLTIEQAARELQCCEETLRRLIRKDLIPAYRLTDKLTRVDLEEIKKAATIRRRPNETREIER